MADQLDEKIYEVFTNFISSSERRLVYYNQLGGLIFKWCNVFIPETEEMGEEIAKALKRIFLDTNNSNIPQEKDGFIKYLRRTLENTKNEFYRSSQASAIKNPRILKDMKNVINMQEHNLGRELSEDEKIQCMVIWFDKSKKSARKYLEAINRTIASNIKNDEGEETDILNNDVQTPYMPKISVDPLVKEISNEDNENYKKAVKEVLDEAQDRTRDCYRALFTLRCIRKIRDYSHLLDLLDKSILDSCSETGKKPTQKEIYLKYHSDASPDSAEVRASAAINEFLKRLNAKLKETE